MPHNRSEILLYVLCAALVVVLGARALRASPQAPPVVAEAPAVRARPILGRRAVEAPRLLVHVVGAVRRPGVYRLRGGERLADALAQAGGASRGADLSAVNLAARAVDGMQVVVPRRRAPRGMNPADDGAPSPAAAGPAATASGSADVPIDLNSATAEQLDTLDGIGPAIAAKIVAWRASNGPFRSVDDLTAVPGIGPKRLAALRQRVRV